MFGSISKGAALLALATVLLLTACQPAVTPTPTADINTINTEIAVTVQAGLTATALAQPTATTTPTPEPTATTAPTATKTATLDVTAISSTLPSLASSTPAAGAVKDKAQWVYNTPADGVTLSPGQSFTLTWRVKNVGETTWSTKYQLRYFLSDTRLRMGANDLPFPKEVKPGEEVDLTLNFTAPSSGGDYTTYWVMTNNEGANFQALTFTFKVSGAPAATSTSQPENTATVAATTETATQETTQTTSLR